MLLRKLLPIAIPRMAISLLFLLFTIWLSYSITTTKIFDAQQIFIQISRLLVSILLPALLIIGTAHIFQTHIPHYIALACCSILSLATYNLLSNGTILPQFIKQNTEIQRQRVHEIAHQQEDELLLKKNLAAAIGNWANTGSSGFLVASRQRQIGGEIEFAAKEENAGAIVCEASEAAGGCLQ